MALFMSPRSCGGSLLRREADGQRRPWLPSGSCPRGPDPTCLTRLRATCGEASYHKWHLEAPTQNSSAGWVSAPWGSHSLTGSALQLRGTCKKNRLGLLQCWQPRKAQKRPPKLKKVLARGETLSLMPLGKGPSNLQCIRAGVPRVVSMPQKGEQGQGQI